MPFEKAELSFSRAGVKPAPTSGYRDAGLPHRCYFLFQSLFVDDLAVEQMDRAIRITGIPRIVSYHANSSTFAMKFAQQIHDRFAVTRIKVSSRFICEQNSRYSNQSTYYHDTLLLT